MTTVYLALGGQLQAMQRAMNVEPAPAVLCSYVYYKTFKPLLQGEVGLVREWVLDSGAFSAQQLGIDIPLQEYIDFCKGLAASPRPPAAIFALDVIGDWRASLANTEAMWKAGVQAIPCWHAGEPWEVLVEMCKQYPRIAVGGTVGLHTSERIRIFNGVFSKVWPARIHGFGVNTRDVLTKFPFDSCDASSWELGALRYGNWRSVNLQSPWLRTGHNLRPEVDHYLDMERQLANRWKAQLQQVRGTR